MRCGVATVVVAAAAAARFSQPRRADELLLLLRNASADFSLPSSASAAVALLPNASAAVALLRPNASAAFSFASSASATLGLPSDASTAFKRLSDASATLGLPSNASAFKRLSDASATLGLPLDASAAFKRLSEALVALGLPLDASAAFGLPLDAPPAPPPGGRGRPVGGRRRAAGAAPVRAAGGGSSSPRSRRRPTGRSRPPRGRALLPVLFLGGAGVLPLRSRPGDDGPAGPDRVELEVFRSDAAARSARFGADERDGVDALRRLVRDVRPDPPWLADDATLVRFLRARGGRRGAAGALRASRVASFGAVVEGPPSPELALCRKWWPVGALAGRDRDGAPVDYHRVGAADLPGVEREVGRAAFLEFVAVLNEECFAGFRAASTDGAVHASGSVIMDMDAPAATRDRRAGAAPQRPTTRRLKRIFIVRAPPAFHAVYRALRPALNAGSGQGARARRRRAAPGAHARGHDPAELGGAGDASTSAGRPVPVGELAFHRGFRSARSSRRPSAAPAARAASSRRRRRRRSRRSRRRRARC
ncbi:hypothetical protein JL721_12831 [Aureococcus anophagefferens]|nr:hypothetical protein JL721_12831 [Aureococcus anophagefferens]